MPVDSDVELNSPNLIQFEPKLLVKYVIIIYALGSAHERFGV